MLVKYLLTDELGNAGQFISLTQGDTKTITFFPQLPNGAPLVYKATVATIVVKVYSQINQASIQKTLAATTVTQCTCTALGGVIGYQFVLEAADTASMAANNSGLPMSVTVTDSSGNVTQYDVQGGFDVGVPPLV